MKTTLTINEITAEWLVSLDIVELTRRSYSYKLTLWFKYLIFNKIDVRSPKRRHVISYKQILETQGKSELTVDGYITVVKLFYKFIEERGYYENIAAGIRSSHLAYEHRKGCLTPIEATSLLSSIDVENAKGVRDKMIIALMLIYGLRACEVSRINVGDISRDGNSFMLRLMRKGRREKREAIAVSNELFNLYEKLAKWCDPGVPLFKAVSSKNKGGGITSATIGRMVKQRCRHIGVDRKEITGHSLRHTCASMLIERGVAVEDVRDVLGHSSTSTTRLYIRAAQKAKILRHNPSLILDSELL